MQFGGTCDQLPKSGAHRRGASALPSQHPQHATAQQCLVTPQQDSWGCAWPTWGCALLSPDPKAASVQR